MQSNQKMSENIDELSLIVRNFPNSFAEDDIRKFIEMFDATHIEIFIEHHAAIVEFNDRNHARHILSLLHQERLENNRISVEFAPKNRNQRLKQFLDINPTKNCASEMEMSQKEQLNENWSTLKRLYATADGLDFEQPPPPYLFYEYPKINRNIIDSICIALEISPKFYIQVLHLMNRMNLEPPFIADDKSLRFESLTLNNPIERRMDVATQTDEIIWQNLIRNKRKMVESDESEMVTSSGSDSNDRPTMEPKRKKIHKMELSKRRQRNLLKIKRLQTESIRSVCDDDARVPQNINEAFDLDGKKSSISRIQIIVPHELKCMERPSEAIAIKKIRNIEPKSPIIWTKIEIDENRIPADQLKGHPMFENYNPGVISNCLYIKNIAKDVTESDLHAIYDRYLEMNCNGEGNIRSIDIRLMQTGRMRGQCFVTFDGPYLDYNDDETNTKQKYAMVEKALRDTNGLIVKSKPLVVVYGKGKSNQKSIDEDKNKNNKFT